MSVLDYIDSSILTSVFDNDIPFLASPRVTAICEELRYTIQNREQIFIYGDYDMDGLSCVFVWREVLSQLKATTPCIFQYQARTHKVDPDIVRQVDESGARVIIICDTGSSMDDQRITELLRMRGYTVIVIDHHVFDGNYEEYSKRNLIFNTEAEMKFLHDCNVSGAYASLLVCKTLCEKYFNRPLPYNAKVFALGSMYADVVDLSSTLGRALYNSVCVARAKGPALYELLNTWKYDYGRRFFSFIVAPKINGCFRMQRWDLLNVLASTSDKYRLKPLVEKLSSVHTEASRLTRLFVDMFSRELIGNHLLCVHELTPESAAMGIQSFTGVVANRIAQETNRSVIAVVKENRLYSGSFRDYYSRGFLQTFQLFCVANGHPAAFGLSFTDLATFKRHLSYVSAQQEAELSRQYVTINSGVLESDIDFDTLALYNEYMNVRPRIAVSHVCQGTKIVRSTKYSKYFTVGLPTAYALKTQRHLRDGDVVLIEPAICRGVELREME